VANLSTSAFRRPPALNSVDLLSTKTFNKLTPRQVPSLVHNLPLSDTPNLQYLSCERFIVHICYPPRVSSSCSTMLEQLPDETIKQIIEFLYTIDHFKRRRSLNRSIEAVSLCSRRLRRIALPLLYHTIATFTLDRIDGLLWTLLESPDHCTLVRRLTIHGIRDGVSITLVISLF
jgi:hypothetical protein